MIRTCSVLASFFRKLGLLSKVTFERKLSSVSLPLEMWLGCRIIPTGTTGSLQ